jgi:ureidoglycolate hydrolase
MLFGGIENHLCNREVFFPMEGTGVMLFAPAGTDPDLTKLEAFYVDGTKAFTIDQGVWHCPPLPLGDYIRIALIVPDGILNDLNLRDIPAAKVVL